MPLSILEPRKSLLVSVALNRTQMTSIYRCKYSCWMLLDAVGCCWMLLQCVSALQTNADEHPPRGDVEAFAHPTRHPQDSAPRQLRGTQHVQIKARYWRNCYITEIANENGVKGERET